VILFVDNAITQRPGNWSTVGLYVHLMTLRTCSDLLHAVESVSRNSCFKCF